VISPLQRPVPDNTQETDIHLTSGRFRPTIQASRWPLVSALYYMETDAFKVPLPSEMLSIELVAVIHG